MSWNPQPTTGGANWQGNQTLVTKNQLLSSIAGVYQSIYDISGFDITNISTLTVSEWVSTPVLYVSDIQGAKIDISGVSISPGGLFNAPIVSLSSLNLKGIDLGGINLSFDLGLGNAIGGLLGGLGAAVGGGLIAVGTGAGLAISGAEQGIGTIIAGRPQNFINQNRYETINFTSQLQVSTLGNANPLYSTIFRTVSSVSADQVPGREIFVSSFFSPGQICIRSVSDPINLITGNPNVNKSTIQSFGQWVPLQGLEPENMVGNSLSTNFISSGNLFAEQAVVNVLSNQGMITDYLQVGQFPTGPSQTAQVALEYEVPLQLRLGAISYARLIGDVNNFYVQSDQDILFTKSGNTQTIPTNARLQLGNNANESILTISSINTSNIFGNFANFSSMVVTNLTVISSFSTVTNVTASNVLSTSLVTANVVSTNILQAQSIFPFRLSTTAFGYTDNRFGPYSILRNDTVVSTTYNSISSITQNILQSQLNVTVNNMTSNAAAPVYNLGPDNWEQWASTAIVLDNPFTFGGIQIADLAQWSSPTATIKSGTFDLIMNATSPQGLGSYRVVQDSVPGQFYSTFIVGQKRPQGFFQSWRFTLPANSNGGWTAVSPAPPPYTTTNSNAISLWQDINDTYIEGTDRLHIRAGDIFLEGNANFTKVATFITDSLITSNLVACNATMDTLSSQTAYFSTLNVINGISTPGILNQQNFTGSLNSVNPINPLNFRYTINSTDFTNIRTLTIPSQGPNIFNSMNVNEWNNTQWNTPIGITPATGVPQVYLGELLKTSGFSYGPAKFWINNTTSPTSVPPITVNIIKPGSWLSTLGLAPATGSGYTLVQTPDGVNWSLTSNVPNPQALGGYSFSNYYNLTLDNNSADLTVGMPLTETISGTKTINAGKIILGAQQIRTTTYASPSYPPRQAGFELSSYYDGDVVFDGSESSAQNLIPTPAGGLLYAVIAWSAQTWFGRIRTKSFGIQGFEISPVVQLISGTFADFAWASARYLNVADISGPEANLREIYFMVPVNFMTQENLVGPY